MFQVLDSLCQSLPHWYTVKYLVMFASYVPGAGFMVPIFTPLVTVKYRVMFASYVPGVRFIVPIFTSLVHSQVSCDVCFLCSRC